MRGVKDWQDENGIRTPSGSPTPGSITLCGWLLKRKKNPDKLMGAWVKRWMIVEVGIVSWPVVSYAPDEHLHSWQYLVSVK